ncbi:MAG: ATP-binding protein [Chitinophagaceae bacterium]
MGFKTVIGQTHLKKELPELLRDNRLAHALIFLGKEGSGALPLALAFAQYVVCERANGGKTSSASGGGLFGEEGPAAPAWLSEACGECAACQKSGKLIHPDIHFSYPVITKKAGSPPLSTDYITEWRSFMEAQPYGNVYDWLQHIGADNKQGNITAHECNDIIRKLNLKSFESEYKVLLMWMPEYLGLEGNKLLKLIEEPPANTLFILVAENESLILPTILSRCQLIKIPLLEDEEVEAALQERENADAGTARQIAGVAGGNYREALQQLQHADEDWHNLLRDWLNAVLKAGPIAQVKWVEKVSGLGREKQKQFLRYFNHMLAQAVHLRVMPDDDRIPDQERDFALRLNKIADLGQQQAIIEELDRASYFIERNANAKMLFHALTIKLYHIIQDKIVFLTE